MIEYEKPKIGNVDYKHPIETTYYDVINYDSTRNLPEEPENRHDIEDDSTYWHRLIDDRERLEGFEEE